MDPLWYLLIGVAIVGAVVIGWSFVRLGKAVAELRRSLAALSEAGESLQRMRAEQNGLGDSIQRMRRK